MDPFCGPRAPRPPEPLRPTGSASQTGAATQLPRALTTNTHTSSDRTDTHNHPPIHVRQPIGQRPHPLLFLDQPLGGDSADAAIGPLVDPVAPRVELQLEVQRVGEAPARLEVRTHEAM